MVLYIVMASKLGKGSSFYEEKHPLTTSSPCGFFYLGCTTLGLRYVGYSSDFPIKQLPICCHKNCCSCFTSIQFFSARLILILGLKSDFLKTYLVSLSEASIVLCLL